MDVSEKQSIKCGDIGCRAVELESEGILDGVGVGKNVLTPTLTSI
jgi:hypothetical protein